jgi:hypothetical protein
MTSKQQRRRDKKRKRRDRDRRLLERYFDRARDPRYPNPFRFPMVQTDDLPADERPADRTVEFSWPNEPLQTVSLADAAREIAFCWNVLGYQGSPMLRLPKEMTPDEVSDAIENARIELTVDDWEDDDNELTRDALEAERSSNCAAGAGTTGQLDGAKS